ncbi:hypothetical protein [Bradyrhizobium sp. STM 3561]|uniref:hypothetical protein n=1 Tax=unclassified Bradyrhizobium TaxID=2631580 RepID=UPI00388DDC94
MSFQLSILKILAGQPHGRASIEVVKQHLAIYYSSGPEWPARMKRIASRAPQLDIFGQRLIEREAGCWIISEEGRKYLETLEQLDRTVMQAEVWRENAQEPITDQPPPLTLQLGMNVGKRRPASD